ncbi:DUF4145 domain-containing protein [Tardiphaga sp. 20_F10_N6_6]|uniref:DUF4145 domain-containing protein n=1 Tax=Tardiphaga sp. 20_F10_N6_6 TaxID=3240788 RepID=UPI003F8B2301
MKCPHCTVTIHESWELSPTYVKGSATLWRTRFMTCPECAKDILGIGKAQRTPNGLSEPKNFTQVIPTGSSRPPVSTDVPQDIASDYKEAALVLPLSSKASAALSRRCLQSILWNAGYVQKDLSKQIDAVLAETDTTKALPTGVHSIVDAIRNFGNFSAHKITDQTSLQVIEVEAHEAEWCLDILDELFDHYYVRPAIAARRKALLDAKLAAGNKPPAK